MVAYCSVVNGVRNEYDGVRNMKDVTMKTDDKWVNQVKGILRAEMTRRGITYDQLSERLAANGVQETPVNLRNKVARGGFSSAFFVQCLDILGCRSISLRDD